MAGISNQVHYANGNTTAESLVDPAIGNAPMLYPPESLMQKLFVLQAMPLQTDRMRARICGRVKNGE
jgi:putrescine transport system substrate-binding protein